MMFKCIKRGDYLTVVLNNNITLAVLILSAPLCVNAIQWALPWVEIVLLSAIELTIYQVAFVWSSLNIFNNPKNWIHDALNISCHRHISSQYKNTLGLYSLCGKTPYRKISWSLEAARMYMIMIVSLWDRHLGNVAAEVPVKFQSDWISMDPNPAASKFHEILWWDVGPSAEWIEALFFTCLQDIALNTVWNHRSYNVIHSAHMPAQ